MAGNQGFAVETAATVEVIAAWVAPKTVVPAVAATPGWRVLGEYYLPKTTDARLDVVHLVSADGLTSRVRLWDVTAKAVVGGSTVSTTSRESDRTLGARMTIEGLRRYQVQAECIGGVGDGNFAVVQTATITD